MKNALINKMVVFILMVTMLVGMMSTVSLAAEGGDVITVTNGRTFTFQERYNEVLTNHPLYGTKDYIAYPWENSFFIWFFNEDISDVQFRMWNRGSNNFGLYPSRNVSFTEYVYDRNTLSLVRSWDRTMNTSNAYNYSYEFIASFNIYTDQTYSTYFYETEENQHYTLEPPTETGDIITVTNGRTFTFQERYNEVLTNHPLYGTKDYIAYPWENSFFIWFFNEDISDVQFRMWNRGSNNFGLYPSRNVSFTEYVYDRNTLSLVRSWNRTINTSNAYNYSYEFIASFNIYTDQTYNTYFYETPNLGGNDEQLVTFEPLSQNDAKDFLRFVANAGPLVNIENKLPQYYSLLTGTIQDPEEELKAKVSFLTYLYYCLDAQMTQYNDRIDMGTTYLINWVGNNNETSSIIYSEVKDELVGHLRETIAESSNIPMLQIAGLNVATTIMDYGDVFIVSLGSIQAIRSRDEIQYLMAYKQLLEARERNDEIDIIAAELNCEMIAINMTFGGNVEEMERFAEYLFNIEQSLPE